jgi:Protein of unknown function (DUF1266)
MATDDGPEAKQWALAATAILTNQTQRQPRHDRLGGADKSPETEATAKTILANAWQVSSTDTLVKTLEWLGGGGHTQDYQKQAALFAQAPPQQRTGDPSLAFVNQFGADIGPKGLLAWDLGRMMAVAGWGYLAGYCTEDQAWGAVLSSGVRLRQAYGSWDEYGKHYRYGALFADAAAAQQIDPILAQLASAPDSPWRLVAWRLDGAAGGFPAPSIGPAPGAPPGGGLSAGAPPGQFGGAPVVGGAPLGGAPMGPQGGPAGYGPPGAPPMPGQPGAPTSYGGVPVIAGTSGGPPGGPPGGMAGGLGGPSYGGVPVIGGAPTGSPMGGMPGMGGGSKKGLIIGGAIAAVVGLTVVVSVAVHFLHHEDHPAAHERGGKGHH